jgi:hypothetical protein
MVDRAAVAYLTGRFLNLPDFDRGSAQLCLERCRQFLRSL